MYSWAESSYHSTDLHPSSSGEKYYDHWSSGDHWFDWQTHTHVDLSVGASSRPGNDGYFGFSTPDVHIDWQPHTEADNLSSLRLSSPVLASTPLFGRGADRRWAEYSPVVYQRHATHTHHEDPHKWMSKYTHTHLHKHTCT